MTKKVRRGLPRAGGALSKIVSALRIQRKQEKDSGTHKRIYSEQGDFSPEAFDSEVASVVDALFSREYLAARGLTDDEAREHNARVTVAVGQVLSHWDLISRLMDCDGAERLGLGTLAAILGFDRDVVARAAAYNYLYGHLHPVRHQLVMHWRKDGLKEWWAVWQKQTRASLNELHRKTGVAKNTLKALAKGAVPGGGVVIALADGLEKIAAEREAVRIFVYAGVGCSCSQRDTAFEVDDELGECLTEFRERSSPRFLRVA